MGRTLQLFFFLLSAALLPGSAAFSQVSSFNISPASGCAPLPVTFSNSSTGTVTSQSWDLGNGTFSNQPSASTTYSTPGIYPVTLVVVRPGVTDTVRNTVQIFDKPTVTFSGNNLAGCAPHVVQFSSAIIANSPGDTSYAWNFGDGNIDTTSSSPSHTYTTAGTYTVSLTVTNGAGCPRLVFQNAYVTVYPIPIPNFTGSPVPLAFCGTPAVVSFTSSVSSGTPPFVYSWNYGDGSTGIGGSSSHSYNTGGLFPVRLTVVDTHLCTGIKTRADYVAVNDTLPVISGRSKSCSGDTVTFTNGTPGGGYTYWNFGDGDTAVGMAMAHQYFTGTYTITMRTEISNCTKTTTKVLTVDSLPTGTISQFPSIPCPAPVPVTFTANSSTGVHYSWFWRSGGTDSGMVVTKNYLYNIFNDQLILTITDANGCKSKVESDTIRIRDMCVGLNPHRSPFYGACSPVTIPFAATLWTTSPGSLVPCNEPYPGTPISWSWNLDPDTSSLPNPVKTYTGGASGVATYSPTCIIVSSNGCPGTGFTVIHVDTPARAGFLISPLAYCPKTPTTFVNTSNPLPGTDYLWGIIGDTDIVKHDTSRLIYSIRSTGIYTIKLITDHLGCMDSFEQHHYVTVHPPEAAFDVVTPCPPSRRATFTNLSAQATSSTWYFGDGTSDTATSPVHTYPDTGTYTARLVAFNSAYNCTDTIEHKIHIIRPILSLTSTFTGACTYDPILFYGRSTYPGTVYYSFLFDTSYQSAIDTVGQAYYSYSNTGFHDVTLVTTSGNNCHDTLKKPGMVLTSRPTVHIAVNPPIGCAPLTVTLTDSSINTPSVPTVRRKWTADPLDTLITNFASVTRTYTKGKYVLYLEVTDSLGCMGTFIDTTGSITVLKPTATFLISDDSACIGEPIAFKDTSLGTAPFTYAWHYGDGTSDTGHTATHGYSSGGEYIATLIVRDSLGCRDTASRNISVRNPTASYSMSDSISICPTKAVFFNNTSLGATNYSWNFGNGGGPVVVHSPSSTFTSPGVYNVYLVAYNNYGCTDTARSVVKVLGYNGAFTYSPAEGCAPMLVQFIPPAATIPQITWDFGDGNIYNNQGTSTSHVYLNPGPYRPKAIFSDGAGCTAFDSGLTIIHVDSVLADFNWSVPCADTPFRLTQNTSALYNAPTRWYWIFSGGDIDSGASVSYEYTTSGNHAVTLVAQNTTGCRDTVTRDVFINPLPTVDATDDTAICPGDKALLVVTGALSYVWTAAAPISCLTANCDSVTVQPPGLMMYYVSGSDSNACVNKDSVRVRIQIKTTSNTGPGGEICLGESYQLKASGAHHYAWTPATTLDDSTSASPIATPTRTTTYTVAAQEGTCLINYTDVTIVVHSPPIFSAGNDETIVRGGAVTLHPTQKGISRIEWLADTTLSCWDCFLPNAHPRYSRTYYATGYNEYGCKVTDSVTVYVHCNGDLVFVPNTFSPNGDGKNDFFFPRGEGVDLMTSFRVFNRWGEMVFERTNLAINDERAGWDGTYKGKILPPDVYVYTMQSRCEDGEVVRWKGDVTLIK